MMLLFLPLALAAFRPIRLPFNTPNAPFMTSNGWQVDGYVRDNFIRVDYCMLKIQNPPNDASLLVTRPSYGGYTLRNQQLNLFLKKDAKLSDELYWWNGHLKTSFYWNCQDFKTKEWHLTGKVLISSAPSVLYFVEISHDNIEPAWQQLGKDLLDGRLANNICSMEMVERGLIIGLSSGSLNEFPIQVSVGGAIGAKAALKISLI